MQGCGRVHAESGTLDRDIRPDFLKDLG